MIVAKREASLRLGEAVRGYAQAIRVGFSEGLESSEAFLEGLGLTQTDVLIAVDALLRAADLEIFEIQIWRSLGRRSVTDSDADNRI